jgi:hypothetical protein
MNIERLEIIAKWLEAGAPHVDGTYGFNMDVFLLHNRQDYSGEYCGTAMCIGGAAIQFFSKLASNCRNKDARARDLLGLADVEAKKLFYPYTLDRHFKNSRDWEWSQIKPQDAAKVIRHLIDTGEVDWEIILDD